MIAILNIYSQYKKYTSIQRNIYLLSRNNKIIIIKEKWTASISSIDKPHLDIPNYPHTKHTKLPNFTAQFPFAIYLPSPLPRIHVPVNYIAFVNDHKFFPHSRVSPRNVVPKYTCHSILRPPFSTDIIPCAKSRSDKLSRVQ